MNDRGGEGLKGVSSSSVLDAIERGLLVFCFLLAVLSLFRIFFLCGMTEYLSPEVTAGEVKVALWMGFRLSMQTAGALTLLLWLPTEAAGLFSARGRLWLYRVLGAVELTLLAIGFGGRFPYYRQFHAAYNQVLFNTANDDIWALTVSLVQEFNLPVRLAGAVLLAALLCLCLDWLLSRAGRLAALARCLAAPGRTLLWSACGAVLYLVGLWSYYGGSLGWQTELNWENIAVTKDRLLNEAILDDVQAVYRGYRLNHRNLACNGLAFTVDDVKRLAGVLAKARAEGSGAEQAAKDADNLDAYLTRQAQGAPAGRPRQIFLIVSESLANWPLLPEYEGLHIADNLRALLAAEDCAYTGAMLPNGATTVSAVMGLVTGFADANLYLTTMPEAFSAPYPTASAPIMRRLGYETFCWYAGPASWERIQDFALAQGYQHFAGRGEMGEAEGNVWGVDDKYFYQAVLSRLKDDTPGFHFLLNVSNHSPYTLDLAKEGFPKEEVRRALPEEAQNDEALLRQLGHYWYADRELGRLVKELRRRFPEALIAIVGDHADRYNIEKNPCMYKQFAVPLLLIGKGVNKKTLPADAAGSQIDILPTLVELSAPQGFTYQALGESLTRSAKRGVNYGYWIQAGKISGADAPFAPEDFQGRKANISEQEAKEMEEYVNAVWAVSWWRAKYGAKLDAALAERK